MPILRRVSIPVGRWRLLRSSRRSLLSVRLSLARWNAVYFVSFIHLARTSSRSKKKFGTNETTRLFLLTGGKAG